MNNDQTMASLVRLDPGHGPVEEDVIVDAETLLMCRLCVKNRGRYQIGPQMQANILTFYDIYINSFDGMSQILCASCRQMLVEMVQAKEIFKKNQSMLQFRKKKIASDNSLELPQDSNGSVGVSSTSFDNQPTPVTTPLIRCRSPSSLMSTPSSSVNSLFEDAPAPNPPETPSSTTSKINSIKTSLLQYRIKSKPVVLKPFTQKTSPKGIVEVPPNSQYVINTLPNPQFVINALPNPQFVINALPNPQFVINALPNPQFVVEVLQKPQSPMEIEIKNEPVTYDVEFTNSVTKTPSSITPEIPLSTNIDLQNMKREESSVHLPVVTKKLISIHQTPPTKIVKVVRLNCLKKASKDNNTTTAHTDFDMPLSPPLVIGSVNLPTRVYRGKKVKDIIKSVVETKSEKLDQIICVVPAADDTNQGEGEQAIGDDKISINSDERDNENNLEECADNGDQSPDITSDEHVEVEAVESPESSDKEYIPPARSTRNAKKFNCIFCVKLTLDGTQIKRHIHTHHKGLLSKLKSLTIPCSVRMKNIKPGSLPNDWVHIDNTKVHQYNPKDMYFMSKQGSKHFLFNSSSDDDSADESSKRSNRKRIRRMSKDRMPATSPLSSEWAEEEDTRSSGDLNLGTQRVDNVKSNLALRNTSFCNAKTMFSQSSSRMISKLSTASDEEPVSDYSFTDSDSEPDGDKPKYKDSLLPLDMIEKEFKTTILNLKLQDYCSLHEKMLAFMNMNVAWKHSEKINIMHSKPKWDIKRNVDLSELILPGQGEPVNVPVRLFIKKPSDECSSTKPDASTDQKKVTVVNKPDGDSIPTSIITSNKIGAGVLSQKVVTVGSYKTDKTNDTNTMVQRTNTPIPVITTESSDVAAPSPQPVTQEETEKRNLNDPTIAFGMVQRTDSTSPTVNPVQTSDGSVASPQLDPFVKQEDGVDIASNVSPSSPAASPLMPKFRKVLEINDVTLAFHTAEGATMKRILRLGSATAHLAGIPEYNIDFFIRQDLAFVMHIVDSNNKVYDAENLPMNFQQNIFETMKGPTFKETLENLSTRFPRILRTVQRLVSVLETLT